MAQQLAGAKTPKTPPDSTRPSAHSGRLGGARADFVAGLGRKVADLRGILARVRDEPTDLLRREELRRKLHALSSSAKLMKFDAMERAISEAVGLLDRTGIDEPLEGLDMDLVEQTLEDLPALAWGDESTRSSRIEKASTKAQASFTALVVGSALIAEALLDPAEDGKPTFACECTPDTQAAFDLAKTTEPDLVVLDADLAYATELVEALLDDPLTEATPLVVVGSFTEPGASARYVAMGVTKTLAKPTSRDTLRAICEEAVDPRRGLSTAHVALGEPTLEELGDRLAAELREAIVGRADPAARNKRISLGEGTEVLGALWGAIARVREVVTARTDGHVRFSAGPDGAMPVAPLLAEIDVARSDRARIRTRGASSEVRLQGRRVVIADDDPAVVWFLADLLKTVGCTVHEAFDGRDALELAYKTSPDLVISDILMPGIDGFTLCRSLRRDVALRDVPVILLSWKEDLLQRVRELGAGAAGYVRKESDTRAIVARVREALRPRARIEARLLEEGEVRGRLDGVSVRTLLEIVCATRPEARVSVRDASFLYEVEIRWGAPQRATRTSGDGCFMKGPRVLAAMLGASAGRFTVSTSTTAIEAELDGNLAAQLAKPIAKARAATSLLTTDGLARVARLTIDEEMFADYGRATPKRPHDLAKRLAAGAAPRTLVLDGACEPSLLEDISCDLAARGLVTAIEDDDGKDILSAAVTRFMQMTDSRASFAPRTGTPSPMPMLTEALVDDETDFSCADDADAPACESPFPDGPTSASSLEDAVMREIATRSPEPELAHLMAERPDFVEPSSLVLRSSPPPGLVLAEDDDDNAIIPDRAWTETPPHEQMLALAEPTIVDDTAYGESSDAVRTDDVMGASAPIAPADPDRLAKTPLTVVKTADDPRPAPKTRILPMVAFAAATALVAYAVMHFAGPRAIEHAQKAAPPPEPVAATTVQSATNVEYTDMTETTATAANQGVLDVSAPGDAVILVDGTERGRGRATITIFSGTHDVRVESAAGDDRRQIEARAGKVAHVKF